MIDDANERREMTLKNLEETWKLVLAFFMGASQEITVLQQTLTHFLPLQSIIFPSRRLQQLV